MRRDAGPGVPAVHAAAFLADGCDKGEKLSHVFCVQKVFAARWYLQVVMQSSEFKAAETF